MKSFFKKYLISGTLVFVPVVATIWILKAVILWLDDAMISFLPSSIRPDRLIGFDIPGIGLLLTIILILLVGIFTRLYIGKWLVHMGDRIFSKLPFGRAIYQAIKQVLDTALTDKRQKLKRVVLIEYPKKDSYALGFLTGDFTHYMPGGIKKAKDIIDNDVMVFVPTAPNPTSGFLLIVPEKSLIKTEMTTEEASKLLISGGLLAKKAKTV